MAAVNPYLTFDGQCDQAFELYKSVFGGDFLAKFRFNEMDSGMPIAENEVNRIMHVSLPIGKGSILMGSDSHSAMGPLTVGDNYSISIQAESEAEADRLELRLSGRIGLPEIASSPPVARGPGLSLPPLGHRPGRSGRYPNVRTPALVGRARAWAEVRAACRQSHLEKACPRRPSEIGL